MQIHDDDVLVVSLYRRPVTRALEVLRNLEAGNSMAPVQRFVSSRLCARWHHHCHFEIASVYCLEPGRQHTSAFAWRARY